MSLRKMCASHSGDCDKGALRDGDLDSGILKPT